MLRDGPWTNRPLDIDRTSVRRPTPAAFRTTIPSPTVEVLPLVKNIKGAFRSGWCTYADALDSPETEVLSGGINAKTASAAAVWRQGHLLHFGFDLSPAEMNERGRALLVNVIGYIARFTEDRPITQAPDRACLRAGADRVMAKKEADKGYLEWYFTPAVRQRGHAENWAAFQAWYQQHRDYLRAERKEHGSLVLDQEAEALGAAPGQPAFFPAIISALRKGGPKAEQAAILARRYVPAGPQELKAELWQRWWEENRPYLFFSESGWYRWYVDPLARQRRVPTAQLRGPARATRPVNEGN